jgi:hypothetical protein
MPRCDCFQHFCVDVLRLLLFDRPRVGLMLRLSAFAPWNLSLVRNCMSAIRLLSVRVRSRRLVRLLARPQGRPPPRTPQAVSRGVAGRCLRRLPQPLRRMSGLRGRLLGARAAPASSILAGATTRGSRRERVRWPRQTPQTHGSPLQKQRFRAGAEGSNRAAIATQLDVGEPPVYRILASSKAQTR